MLSVKGKNNPCASLFNAALGQFNVSLIILL